MTNMSVDYKSMVGKVFIESGPIAEGGWKRVSIAQAKAWRKKPIPCSLCKRPAASLDHFYPYHTERNLCQFHLDKEKVSKL